jgi:hypothetical protein
MCSSTEKAVQQSDLELQQQAQAQNAAFMQDFQTTFAEQQAIQGSQAAKLAYIQANPMGYTPAEIHGQITNIDEQTANAAKQAIGAASAFAAAHGAPDIGGGTAGVVAGQIGAATGAEKSRELTSLSMANEQEKQANLWKALGGLQEVGAQYGQSAGQSAGAAGNAIEEGVGAGGGAVSADLASTQKTAGILGAIGGLTSAGASFVQANPNGIFGS